MIVGTGNIASILEDREGAVFFAAGVSNSKCEDLQEFAREHKLLRKQDKSKCLVYFSSIATYTTNNAYFRHKKKMEFYIKMVWKNHIIIRIGNIDWDQNPNTFLNYLRNKIKQGETVEIFDEYRYMISKDQLLLLTNNLPLTGQHEINAFGYMKLVKDLL